MSGWVPIEHIAFRGGPRDGEQLHDVGGAGLLEVVTAQTADGVDCRYRKSGEHHQLRGQQLVEPYSRIWFYDWLPGSDDGP